MNNKKIVKSGFRVISRYKLRSFFMMLGVIIGIAALTLILSLGKGTKQKLVNKVKRLFNESNIMINAGGGEMMSGSAQGPATTLTMEDLEALQEQIPNIEKYDPMQMAAGRSVKYQGKSMTLRVMGSSSDGEEVWNRGAASGSYFTAADIKQSARVAVLGTAVVKELFEGSDPVGEQIRVGNVLFRVIGVLEPLGIDPHGMDRDNEIAVPITTLMRRLMNIDYINGVKLQLADKNELEANARQIREILRERHSLAAGEPDDFHIITPKQVATILSKMNNLFSVFLPLIVGISLLAGGIVVAALMLISVNERTSEIGLRKALGARARDIRLQFMAETAFITLTGGIIGFLVGTLAVQAFVIVMKLPPIVPWEAFLLGTAFSLIVGMTAGVIPARRAAALEPVETLK
ncbi:MAG: FtsX-like permease family protein [bacterium]|nr:FtsX-like permease family protein [bacterium]